MKNVFKQDDIVELINRINKLTSTSKALWGKMTVDQMLAHCNVTYELVYDNIHTKPNIFKKFMLKLFVKNIVVGDKSYKKNERTAPEFLQTENKNFENEKKRLIDYINKTQLLGEAHFNDKKSHSFGSLTKEEWNIMFIKHLDHHLNQFGV
ncbi:MAG: DUF1569 domain-containing protein [Bacteroidia bacterium]